MSALYIEVEALERAERLSQPGHFRLPIRRLDDGDCFVTFSGVEVDLGAETIEVLVIDRAEILDLDEPGGAICVIQSIVADALSQRGDLASTFGLRAFFVKVRANYSRPESLYIVRRQLAQSMLDICEDSGTLLIGVAEISGKSGESPISLSLRGRSADPGERDNDCIDRDYIKSKRIAIIGLGSVGSQIAIDLARVGVGHFTVADGERLDWGNIVRHAAGLSDVGRRKSKVVASLIRDRNPAALVREISVGLDSDSLGEYEDAILNSDVVLCATDSKTSRLICNRLCVRHGRCLILGGLSTGAYSGMVFRFHPGRSMCYHCFVSNFPEASADREESQSAYSGGPDRHIFLDILPITQLMSRLALLELQTAVKDGAASLNLELKYPWYIWINRREGEYSGLPALGESSNHPRILQWTPVMMERLKDCPHCGGH